MSFSTLQYIDTALSKFTFNQIQGSLLSVIPIYKQLAFNNITDEDIPPNALPWITYLDIFAIQTNKYGYFDCDGIFETFESDLTKKIFSFKKHKQIKQFLIDLYLFECERVKNINQYIQENNCHVFRC